MNDIHQSVRSVYNSTIRGVVTRLGLHEHLRKMYYLMIKTFTDNVLTHQIGDTEVRYVVRDYESWKRQQSFVGELEVMERFANDISDSDVVWDVGANVGTYTCLAGEAADDIAVFAFEPLSKNISTLEKNIEVNDTSATIIPKALSDSNGEMGFESPSSGGGGDYSLTSGRGEVTVETITGDSIIESGSAPVPDIIKIDVEGAEARVAKGLIQNIDSIDTVYVELHPKRICSHG